MAILGVAALGLLWTQNAVHRVEIVGSGAGPGPTPIHPTPTPQFIHCDSRDAPCRRLAAKQPLPTVQPGVVPPAPHFEPEDFHDTDSYALRGKRVLLPHCGAWNTDVATGGGPDPDATGSHHGHSAHAYYYGYAVPDTYGDMRAFVMNGFDSGGIFGLQRGTINIGQVGGTPTPYRVRVTTTPLYCEDAGGTVADVEP